MERSLPPIRVIGAACGQGSPDIRCAEGPAALRAAGLLEHIARLRPGATWGETLDCTPANRRPLDSIAGVCERLAQEATSTMEEGALPLVLTGDHSCAVGVWAGVSRALGARGRLGLVWVDAHLDSHTPETSHTGAINGMPLAALLGYGDDMLTACGGPGAKILPGNLCIVGARSYEAEEIHFLAGLGVRIFFTDEVMRRGTHAVLRDAVEIVRAGTAGYGLSIDLDAIDPRQAPGVGTPAANGLDVPRLCAALRGIGNDRRLAGIEISEYNPSRDLDGRTARVVLELVDSILAPRAGD